MENTITSKTNVTWEVFSNELNKSETLSFVHSNHSIRRAKQRNINDKTIAMAIEYGKAFFKQGMIFYVLGKNAIKKTKNIVVVVAGDSNRIITCYRTKNPFKHIKKKQNNLVTY